MTNAAKSLREELSFAPARCVEAALEADFFGSGAF